MRTEIRTVALALLIAGCAGKNGILTVPERVAESPPEIPDQNMPDSQEPPPPEPEVEPPATLPDVTSPPVTVTRTKPAPYGNPPAPPSTQWVKVWGDEFDGDAIDREKWRYTPAHWERKDRNQGTDCKVNWNWKKRDNVMVADGNLILRNTKVQPPPEGYDGDVLVQPAAVYSRGVFERTYGYFEARIRSPLPRRAFTRRSGCMGTRQETQKSTLSRPRTVAIRTASHCTGSGRGPRAVPRRPARSICRVSMTAGSMCTPCTGIGTATGFSWTGNRYGSTPRKGCPMMTSSST